MSCVSQNSLQAFLDEELAAPESEQVAAHLRQCTACSREVANCIRLKSATQRAGKRFKPSPAFREKMIAQVSGPKPKPWNIRLMALTSFATAVVVIAVALGWLSYQRGVSTARELADAHISATASPNPVDVVSSDRHTVKPWFAGKLPFTFNVPELDGTPYKLLGGRLAYIDQAPAAQLLFSYREHRVSVFIQQDRGASNKTASAPANFTELTWRKNGLSYYLVTDSAPESVRDLVERIKSVE
jgi:anti-sigma factor RsiW